MQVCRTLQYEQHLFWSKDQIRICLDWAEPT
jgi:hypothetical protein